MKGTWIIFKKEFKDFFSTSLFYLLLTFFSIVVGYFFFNYLASANQLTTKTILTNVISPLFGNINLLMLILTPLLTMKIFSTEKKDGTLDILFLSNLKSYEILLGKYLALLSVIVVLLLFCGLIPISLAFFQYTNWWLFFTAFIGLLLCASTYLSIGVFCSSLTENQILASFMSYGIILFLIFLVYASNATNNELSRSILQYLSISFHFNYFSSGSIPSYSLNYFSSANILFLYLTYLSLERRKW